LGKWRATIEISRHEKLPFSLISKQSDSGDIQFILKNDTEEIVLNKFDINGDSLILPMHIFDTKIVARIDNDQLDGHWTKNYYQDYTLPFHAELGKDHRFEPSENPANFDFSGRWQVEFSDEEKSYPAIGEFKQEGDRVTGSFLTNTGDYRFLEGSLTDNGFRVSTFDGEHAYLFEATPVDSDSIVGKYWSGKTGYYTWKGVRNENAELADPYHLTKIDSEYNVGNIAFPNEFGDTISLRDPEYEGKVVILQILGSWCANCMDETAFLSEWYKNNHERGVEIVGLAFERKDDFNYGASRIKILKERYDIDYEILFAGKHGKSNVQSILPMIEDFRSFPTTIFIDENGKIAKVHAGFSGPGTGEHYREFVKEFNATIDQLLK